MSAMEHGVPAGFDAGCRTASGCPNWGSAELMTCEEAKRRARWDVKYREAPSAERERFEGEGFAKYRHVARPVWAEDPFELEPVLPTSTFDREGLRRRASTFAERIEAAAGVPVQVIENTSKRNMATEDSSRAESEAFPVKRSGGRPPEPIRHGTKAGYVRGCRLGGDCPSKLAGGLSCLEAQTEYHRDLRLSKKPPVPAAPVPAGEVEQLRRELAIARNELAEAQVALEEERTRTRALLDRDMS